ncbi:hypothetical protein PJIAN_1945 [Paludibacter jiangxiensis]|uniref:Uncharacterized protein n=1 Tax=Paludibacter jiangxiensis TaxID=681398 RepID=A0A170Z5W0_9BACT|nr:hypothetical protein PJIAN_1945 [Paludibacter jiangxiensis]
MEFSGEISESLNDSDFTCVWKLVDQKPCKGTHFYQASQTKRCFPCLFNNKNARKQTKIAILPPLYSKIVILCRLKNNIFSRQNLQIDFQSPIFDAISNVCYVTFKFI